MFDSEIIGIFAQIQACGKINIGNKAEVLQDGITIVQKIEKSDYYDDSDYKIKILYQGKRKGKITKEGPALTLMITII